MTRTDSRVGTPIIHPVDLTVFPDAPRVAIIALNGCAFSGLARDLAKSEGFYVERYIEAGGAAQEGWLGNLVCHLLRQEPTPAAVVAYVRPINWPILLRALDGVIPLVMLNDQHQNLDMPTVTPSTQFRSKHIRSNVLAGVIARLSSSGLDTED